MVLQTLEWRERGRGERRRGVPRITIIFHHCLSPRGTMCLPTLDHLLFLPAELSLSPSSSCVAGENEEYLSLWQ